MQSVNATTSKLYGVESGIDYQVSTRVSFRAVLNYTRGQQRIAVYGGGAC